LHLINVPLSELMVGVWLAPKLEKDWESPVLSRQISAVTDLCCIVTQGLVESVGGVFDPFVSSALAVFEHVKDGLAVIPCLLLATL